MDPELAALYGIDDASAGGTLHGNLPADMNPGNASIFAATANRAGARSNSSFFRTQPHQDDSKKSMIDGRLNLRTKKWQNATYMLPPCPGPDTSRETKASVLHYCIANIREAEATWQDKTELLSNHFESSMVLMQAKARLTDFQNVTSACFAYTYNGVKDSNFANVDPAAAAFRTDARFTMFDLTINADQINPTFVLPADHRVGTETKRIHVRLPTEVVPNAAGVLTTQVHNALDGNTVRVFVNINQVLQTLNAPVELAVLKDNVMETESIVKWKKKIYWRVLYEHVAALLQPTFVGMGVIKTATNRLRECHMQYRDEAGVERLNSVQKHYKVFSNIVAEMDVNVDFQVPLAYTFYYSLVPKIQEKLNIRNYTPPTTYNSNEEQLRQLNLALIAATDAELQLKSEWATAKSALGARFKTSGSMVMMTTPQQTFRLDGMPTSDDSSGMQWLQELDPLAFGQNTSMTQQPNVMTAATTATFPMPAIMPAAAATSGTNSADEEFEALITRVFFMNVSIVDDRPALVFLSAAEQAMKNASGIPAPFECWGCREVEEFKHMMHHKFQDCPNRHDPRVNAAGSKAIQALRERWRSQKQQKFSGGPRQARNEDTVIRTYFADRIDNFERHGLPTKDIAKMLVAALTNSVSKRRKKIALKTLLIQLQNTNLDATPADEGRGYGVALVTTVRRVTALSANVNTIAFPLDVQPELPHFDLPLGRDDDGLITLAVAADSCAALNLGHLGYHQRVYELYPEVVVKFITIDDASTTERLEIGGVDKSGEGVRITHVIVYATPFRSQGEGVSVSFGLAEQVSCTAILGVTFHRKAKCTVAYTEPPSIHVGIFNDQFPIAYKVPALRQPPSIRVDPRINKALTIKSCGAFAKTLEDGQIQETSTEEDEEDLDELLGLSELLDGIHHDHGAGWADLMSS